MTFVGRRLQLIIFHIFMVVGFDTRYPPIDGPDFTIKNMYNNKTIKVFSQGIPALHTYNLMNIPGVSEADIKASLIKGELKIKIEVGAVTIVSSNLNLVQYSPAAATYLRNAGASTGTQELFAPVSNISTLSTLDDTVYPDGSVVPVSTVIDLFALDKESSLTIDGITVVGTNSGTGRWIRKAANNSKWASQYTWYVDSVAGDDENTGDTAETALKTFGELARRMGTQTYNQFVTINILNDIDESDAALYASFHSFATITGTETTVATGTITSITQWDHDPVGGVANGTITDSNLSGNWSVAGPGGTSLIDKKIIITDGASAGAWTYIVADTGSAKEAHVGPWLNPDTYTEAQPAIGSAYKVVDLPAFTDRFHVKPANSYVYLRNLRFASILQYYPSLLIEGSCAPFGCIFDGTIASINTVVNGQARQIYYGHSYFKSGIDLYGTPFAVFVGSVFKGLGFAHISSAYVEIQMPIALYNTQQTVHLPVRDNSSLTVTSNGSIGVVVIGANTDGSVIRVRGSSSAIIHGTVYSIGGTTGDGIFVSAGGSVLWTDVADDANTKFSFASANDFNIGGTTRTIASLSTTGYLDPNNGAKLVPTED